MKKTDPSKLEEFIRVDHAGERGAIKIYEGQLLALNTLIKDEDLKKTVEEMKVHEKEHHDYFEKEIKKKYKTYKIVAVMGSPWNWIRFWIYHSWKKHQCYVLLQ